LRDINYSIGSFLGFIAGIALYATMALMPSMLQTLLGYPVITTGILLMPRGIGTLVAMAVVGRLVRSVDTRILLVAGFGLTALSLWQMAQFNLDVTASAIFSTGIIQGFGIGLIFVPLTTISFSTLNPKFRTESTAVYTLIRSIGSSIGISGVSTLLVRNTQISHSDLVQNITPFSHALQSLLPNAIWSLGSQHGIAALAGEIDRQATMIAYIDIFQLMAYGAIATVPLVLLLRPAKSGAPLPKEQMVMEH
jgi:DHA2 family multidrug resistance protein